MVDILDSSYDLLDNNDKNLGLLPYFLNTNNSDLTMSNISLNEDDRPPPEPPLSTAEPYLTNINNQAKTLHSI